MGLRVPAGKTCSGASDCDGELEWEGGGEFEYDDYVVGNVVADNSNHSACMAMGVRRGQCCHLALVLEGAK